VGCEACHGPGERHVQWAKQASGAAESDASEDLGLLVPSRKVTAKQEIETCARCHARRQRVSEEDLHGRAFLDDFRPALLRPGLYHADGQILDEVYVYGSFMQSAMAAKGVRCSDCHAAHGLALRAQGNDLCTSCHAPEPDPRFPSLRAARYDTPDHHHHEPGSPGAQCVNCHMPSRNYMVIDPRRDHSFRIPRPDLSASIGVPNACDDCHAHEGADFSRQALATWNLTSPPGHAFAEAFARARAGDTSAADELRAIAKDPGLPAIVRATALELIRNTSGRGGDALRKALRDPEPLVRAAAAASLDTLPPGERVEAGGHLLEDPSRSVRVEAAQKLADLPRSALSTSQRRAFAKASAEFEGAQRAAADQPAANFSLGVFYDAQGQLDAAQSAFETALAQDARFLPAAANLANLHNRRGHNDAAESVLRAALAVLPDEGELHYSLGLLLAEMGRLEEAESNLARAASLLPERPRVRYNHALALQHLGRRDRAEAALLAALEIAPGDPTILEALVVYYLQEARFDAATLHARSIADQFPEAPGAREMLRHIEAQRRRHEQAPRAPRPSETR